MVNDDPTDLQKVHNHLFWVIKHICLAGKHITTCTQRLPKFWRIMWTIGGVVDIPEMVSYII